MVTSEERHAAQMMFGSAHESQVSESQLRLQAYVGVRVKPSLRNLMILLVNLVGSQVLDKLLLLRCSLYHLLTLVTHTTNNESTCILKHLTFSSREEEGEHRTQQHYA